MGPLGSRKRQKKDSSTPDHTSSIPSRDLVDEGSTNVGSGNSGNRGESSSGRRGHRNDENVPQDSPGRGWQGGTWPRLAKSPASTQVAKESILVSKSDRGKGTISRLSRPSSTHSNKSFAASTPSDPKSRSRAELDLVSRAPTSSTDVSTKQAGEAKAEGSDGKPVLESDMHTQSSSSHAAPEAQSSTWFGWLSRGAYEPQSPASKQAPNPAEPTADNAARLVMPSDESHQAQAPQTPFNKAETIIEASANTTPSKKRGAEPLEDARPVQLTSNTTPKGWLGRWSGSGITPALQNLSADKSPAVAVVDSPKRQPEPSIPPVPDMPEMAEVPSESKNAISPSGVRSSGWAFWSKGTPKSANALSVPDSVQTPSPSQQEAAASATKSDRTVTQGTPGKGDTSKKPEAKAEGQRKSVTITTEVPSHSTEQKEIPKALPQDKAKVAPKAMPQVKVKETKDSMPSQPSQLISSPQNLLLPRFKDTYRLLEQPSILEQIARLLRYSRQPSVRHVNLAKEPHRIKKALAIGVHGYFPAPLLRTVLGQPTGTSIRFATSAAEAIEKWTTEHGYSCQIDKVALEGEGRIADRVETLWKLMLDWLDHIRKADFILVACHSQGVPVATMLLARLLTMGCVSNARIGICAMAGINLGPFSSYNSRIFSSGTAGELFEFSNPKSMVSQNYEEALRVVLRKGVRIVYAGSIDDQLVSLESSTFSPAGQPYIYRAVFIDGRIHAPDFITHLVGFALKLRNLGISDHGLIRELSAPLAGSLYTGEGHSRIYDDALCYSLALEHALCSTSLTTETEMQVFERKPDDAASNPFILPWSMRGLLEEDYVRSELGKETEALLKKFEEWRPTSKALKDVKFRLEAIRSRL